MHRVERFIIIGDSLSDIGQMEASLLQPLSGLDGYSPYGRFTNGFNWVDFAFYRLLNSQSDLNSQPQTSLQTSTAEGITTTSSQLYVRTYCIGGLTAFDYRNTISFDFNPINDIEGFLLSSLAEQREKIIEDDENIAITLEQKQSTLVVEWSGANDLITINSTPTEKAAEQAIAARIENIEILSQKGYKRFILFNMPDLSLTPRLQKEDEDSIKRASRVVDFFNRQLTENLKNLKDKLPLDCIIEIYDVNSLFKDAYAHPERYTLDSKKLKSPLVKSESLKNIVDPHVTKGYMFWDEVHPTQLLHSYLASGFLETFGRFFEFQATQETLRQQFIIAYGLKLDNQQSSFMFRLFPCCFRNNFDYKNATLHEIFYEALCKNNMMALNVIQDLGWIDTNKKCSSSHPSIVAVIETIDSKLDHNNVSISKMTTHKIAVAN